VAIADVNLPRAQQRAAKYKAAVYKDYRELLERKDVDLPSENPSQIRSP
jgi:predicted dehydrogenase